MRNEPTKWPRHSTGRLQKQRSTLLPPSTPMYVQNGPEEFAISKVIGSRTQLRALLYAPVYQRFHGETVAVVSYRS